METCGSNLGNIEKDSSEGSEVNGVFHEMFDQLVAQNNHLRNTINILERKFITLFGPRKREDKAKAEIEKPQPNCWLYLMDNELKLQQELIKEFEILVQRL